MTRFLKLTIALFSTFILSCSGNQGTNNNTPDYEDSKNIEKKEVSEFSISSTQDENDTILLRIAFLGDGEPKPLAEFPGMEKAVNHINQINASTPIDFAIGIGDIAHKGTEIQYEAATEVLKSLEIPFYPIMGNEEHNSTIQRYLGYAQKWNPEIKEPSYIINHEKIAFVLASPDYERDFHDSGVEWITHQIKRLNPKPVFLIVHGAQTGIYPEKPDKGIKNQLFIEQVIPQTNLKAVISGDLHMDMNRTNHSKKIGDIHYLHIPALERTKVPDETSHSPVFRIMTISKNGVVTTDTYTAGENSSMEEHQYIFRIKTF